MCLCNRQPFAKIPPCKQAALWAGCSLVAAAKCAVVRWLLIVLCIGLVMVLAGCKTATVKPRIARPPVNAAPVVAGQLGKDATVLDEAAKIDALAPEAKPHTDAQRKAVADNPAQDVARIVAEFQAREKERDAADKETAEIIAGLRKEIEDLKSAEQKKQVATCRWIGFGLLATALLLGYARQMQFAAVAGGIGFLALGLAQLLAQPWFTVALNCAIGVAVIALGAAAWHAYRKGDLAAKTANEAAKLKDTLSVMVPALDGALKDIDAASQSVIRSTLSRFMDREHKDLIKQVRLQADKPLTS